MFLTEQTTNRLGLTGWEARTGTGSNRVFTTVTFVTVKSVLWYIYQICLQMKNNSIFKPLDRSYFNCKFVLAYFFPKEDPETVLIWCFIVYKMQNLISFSLKA